MSQHLTEGGSGVKGWAPFYMSRYLLFFVMASCTVSMPLRAERMVAAQMQMEEFLGGTGRTAAELVRKELERAGGCKFVEENGQWMIRAGSSAGRIDGAIVSAKGEMIFNNQYDSGDLRVNAALYADDIMEAVSGVRGVSATSIVFVSDRSGRKEIHITSPDGERVQQVTRDGRTNLSPSLGRDGAHVVFTSYASGFTEVVRLDLRTGERARLLSAAGTNSGAAFSHDGSRLALSMSHGGDPDIYTATANGGSLRPLVESKSVEFSPAWAPDGRRLVFCSDATGASQLYVCQRRGGKPERLDTGYAAATSPDWSPDGKRIAFTGHGKGGAKSVVLFDLQTGRSQPLIAGAEDPTWAPDGRHIAAVMGKDLIVINTHTGQRHKVVLGYGRISEPAWSK